MTFLQILSSDPGDSYEKLHFLLWRFPLAATLWYSHWHNRCMRLRYHLVFLAYGEAEKNTTWETFKEDLNSWGSLS
jgi:hypothetical protein